MRIKFLLLLVFPFIIYNTYSQERLKFNEIAEKEFFEALQDFKVKNYDRAVTKYEKLIKSPFHQRTTASYIMLAKTFTRMGEFKKSNSILEDFIDEFRESNYLEDAYYIFGKNYYSLGEYESSATYLLFALEITSNPKKVQSLISKLEIIISEKISTSQINNLIKKQKNEENTNLLKILISEKLFSMGEISLARSYLSPIIKKGSTDKHKERARAVWMKISKGLLIKVGVLVPLMQSQPNFPSRDIGEDILYGIQFAVDEFNENSELGYKVVLDIRDTDRDSQKATKEVRSLAAQKEVVALIGPVFSNTVQACAQVANERKIPLITPTANADGISAIGEYIFQANPDFNNRGRAMAKFAVEELGLVNIAVVSSNEPANRSISESFISEVKSRGGKIIAVEWYDKGTTDLSEQFKNIRRIALTNEVEPVISFSAKITAQEKLNILRAGANLKLVDSLIEIGGNIGINLLFGKRGKIIADSLGLRYFIPAANVDDNEFPVTSVHGIFFPITSADEIPILSSQMHFYNINTQILGNSEWHNEIELNRSALHTQNAIFISEMFIDYEQPSAIEFSKNYRKKFLKSPSKNSLFGFDAMSIVLDQIKKGSVTREKLKLSLSKLENFPGLHSKISFTQDRVNSHFHILKYLDGKVIKIGEINLTKN